VDVELPEHRLQLIDVVAAAAARTRPTFSLSTSKATAMWKPRLLEPAVREKRAGQVADAEERDGLGLVVPRMRLIVRLIWYTL